MYCGTEFFGWHGFFGFPFGFIFMGLLIWLFVSLIRRDRVQDAPNKHTSCCDNASSRSFKYCPHCGKPSDGSGV